MPAQRYFFPRTPIRTLLPAASEPRLLAISAVVLSLFCISLPAAAQDNILLVGNSFTGGGVKARLKSLIRSSDHDARVAVRAPDGWTLGDHARSGKSLRKIRQLPWTHVVLQEQSAGEFASRYPDARALDAEIDAIGAQTMFFMTWRDRGAALSDYDSLLGTSGGSIGYVPIAVELDAVLSPVGWVFRELLVEEPDAELWGRDGHHASERGRYLAALTLYAMLYGESPVGLWATPFLTDEQVLHDQMLVERVIFGGPRQWDLGGLPLD